MTIVAEDAAALVIGNELLSGKTQESNLIELARVLRGLGVRLVRAVIVQDDVTTIAREVRELSQSTGVVFTSGGVGPTHDDVTIEAVARAFDADVVIDPYLEGLVRERYGAAVKEAHLRMALVPRGAELVGVPDVKWPATLMRNVFVLPGVPEIFRMKLDAVRSHLRGTRPFASRAAFLAIEEAELKPVLDAIVAAHPAVEVGSYPKWFEPAYKTKVTFDGRDRDAVEAALDDFAARVGSLVRVE